MFLSGKSVKLLFLLGKLQTFGVLNVNINIRLCMPWQSHWRFCEVIACLLAHSAYRREEACGFVLPAAGQLGRRECAKDAVMEWLTCICVSAAVMTLSKWWLKARFDVTL